MSKAKTQVPEAPVTEPTVTPGWRMGAVTFWWVTLAAAVMVSSIGNIVRANATAPEGWQTVAAWIGGGLPVTLMLLIEGIAIAERGGASGRARVVGLTILLPLLGVVLGNSYLGLLVIAEKTGHLQGPPVAVGLGYGLAALPDMLMVAATAYLMAFRSPVGEPTAGRWSRISAALGDRLETAVTSAPNPVPAPAAPVAPVTQGPEVAETAAEVAEAVPPAPAPADTAPEVTEPATSTEAPVPDPAPELPEPTASEHAEAARIVEAGVSGTADEAMVAAVLAASRRGPGRSRTPGMSAREVTGAFPISRTTVTAILAEAAVAAPRMTLVSGGDR